MLLINSTLVTLLLSAYLTSHFCCTPLHLDFAGFSVLVGPSAGYAGPTHCASALGCHRTVCLDTGLSLVTSASSCDPRTPGPAHLAWMFLLPSLAAFLPTRWEQVPSFPWIPTTPIHCLLPLTCPQTPKGNRLPKSPFCLPHDKTQKHLASA
jgi:hypothetical protein